MDSLLFLLPFTGIYGQKGDFQSRPANQFSNAAFCVATVGFIPLSGITK